MKLLKELVKQRKPKVIDDSIYMRNEVTELDYEGVIVKGNFRCVATEITSLKGSPIEVGGYFNASDNRITSLIGAPRKVGGRFNISETDVTSIEGAPSWVGDDFAAYGTKIISLHNVHKYIKYIGGELHLPSTVKSHILGVMFIKGLTWMHFEINGGTLTQDRVKDIVNKHLQGDRNIHACQEELIEAGLKEFARL